MKRRNALLLVAALLFVGCESEATSAFGLGEQCNKDSDCESKNCLSMVCMPVNATVPRSPNGQPCSRNDDCASNICNSDVCSLKSGDKGTTYVTNGNPCSVDSDCLSNHCIQRICQESDNPTEAKKGNGESCSRGDECASNICNSGICSLKPEDKTPTYVANGNVCSVNSDCLSSHCIQRICQESDNPTEAKKGNGRGCIQNVDCASGICIDRVCRDTNDTTQPKLADGKACTSNDQCESSNCYNSTTCRPITWDVTQGLDLNESCATNDICESNLCIDNHCVAAGNGDLSNNKNGLGKKAVGETCAQNAECETGLCYNNQCSDQCELYGCVEAYYVCRAKHCIPVETVGTDCYKNTDCSFGHYCCNGFCTSSKCEVGIDCEHSESCENGCNYNQHCKCRDNSECGKNYYCGHDASWGTLCYPVKKVDAECSYSYECMDGLYCANQSKCVLQLANELKCRKHEQCASGRCEDKETGNATEDTYNYPSLYCAPKAENGRQCEIDANCVSNYCKPSDRICADRPIQP